MSRAVGSGRDRMSSSRMRGRMGSGGPRGLQILRSGVSVRGGFDSHAFPPFFATLFALALSVAGPAYAQTVEPDSLPHPRATVHADTTQVAGPAAPAPDS